LKYAVALVHYRNWPGVAGTLAALRGQTCPPQHIVIVDNSPGATELAEAVSGADDVTFVPEPRNLGYAAGMNRALQELEPRGDWDAVLCVTHEVRLRPDAVETLLLDLETHPGTGAVGPLLGRADEPGLVWSAGGQLAGRRLLASHEAMREPLGRVEDTGRRTCAWLDGAALLLRRAAVERAGPFDPAYFLYWEEVEYALRLASIGYDVACVTGAVCWQTPAGTPLYLEGRNRLLLLRRHGRPRDVALELLVQAARIPRAAAGALTGRRSARDPLQRGAALSDGLTGRLRRNLLR